MLCCSGHGELWVRGIASQCRRWRRPSEARDCSYIRIAGAVDWCMWGHHGESWLEALSALGLGGPLSCLLLCTVVRLFGSVDSGPARACPPTSSSECRWKLRLRFATCRDTRACGGSVGPGQARELHPSVKARNQLELLACSSSVPDVSTKCVRLTPIASLVRTTAWRQLPARAPQP